MMLRNENDVPTDSFVWNKIQIPNIFRKEKHDQNKKFVMENPPI